jgi:hypothetical protein
MYVGKPNKLEGGVRTELLTFARDLFIKTNIAREENF